MVYLIKVLDIYWCFGNLWLIWRFFLPITNLVYSVMMGLAYLKISRSLIEKKKKSFIKVYKECGLSLMVAIWKLSFTNRSENQTTIRTDLVLTEIIHLKYWSNFNSLLGSDYRKIVITIVIIIISSLFNVDIS